MLVVASVLAALMRFISCVGFAGYGVVQHSVHLTCAMRRIAKSLPYVLGYARNIRSKPARAGNANR